MVKKPDPQRKQHQPSDSKDSSRRSRRGRRNKYTNNNLLTENADRDGILHRIQNQVRFKCLGLARGAILVLLLSQIFGTDSSLSAFKEATRNFPVYTFPFDYVETSTNTTSENRNSQTRGNHTVQLHHTSTTNTPTDTTPTIYTTMSSSNNNWVIDILAIGSNDRPQYIQAQKQSWASHISVRHFFNATEDDEFDKDCGKQLTLDQVWAISRFCKSKHYGVEHNWFQYTRNTFAHIPWLQQKPNPVGWMCAQRRPLHGLYKVLSQYRSGVALPSHLIVMDDDTYFNLETFQEVYKDDTPESPLVRAGCLVRSPIHQINFTFPFGGYGVILNQAALKVLLKPIECPRDTEICSKLERNEIFERETNFQNGMALVDILQGYAQREPYRACQVVPGQGACGNWTSGYCVHSDWTIGRFSKE